MTAKMTKLTSGRVTCDRHRRMDRDVLACHSQTCEIPQEGEQ